MTEIRERLIEEVKRCPVLYDTSHENHRDLDARDQCWAEIAEKMDVNSDVLKREWKMLRDSFRQALRRSNGRINKNAENKNEWRFQSKMSYLVPFMSLRTRRNRALARLEGKKETNTNNTSSMEFEHESNGDEAEAWSAEKAEADARADRNSLELFFASVCASARRLPTDMQRELKRSVLDTLLALEARSETITSDPPDLKPETRHY